MTNDRTDALRDVRKALRRFDGVSGAIDPAQHEAAIEGHLMALKTDARAGFDRPPERFRCIEIAAHALALIGPEPINAR
jgi:hypothetical protein